MANKQYILCAAIRYRNEYRASSGPTNVNPGMVVCGRRHHDCYEILKHIIGFDEKLLNHTDFGFITSDNLYVTRKEAYKIAYKSNQLIHDKHDKTNLILTSECLYWGNDK